MVPGKTTSYNSVTVAVPQFGLHYQGDRLTSGESHFLKIDVFIANCLFEDKVRKMYGATVFVPSQKGYLNTSFGSIDEKEDDSNLEELDLPTDFKDLPVRIDWNAELPANIIVPRVDLHSLILDFAAVSFLDISALKELKTVSLKGIV